ncbi:hypothetical protein H0H93_000710 [Arthromyces matolae]|nr:hypothetical protein H0H93_000710 [Arthromyces matolae]
MARVVMCLDEILDILAKHPSTSKQLSKWAHAVTTRTYMSEIATLSRQENGLHYLASGITEEKLQSFEIENISEVMSKTAPGVWELFSRLLTADTQLQSRRERRRRQGQEKVDSGGKESVISDVDMEPSHADERYWEFYDEIVPIVEEDEDEPEDVHDQLLYRERRITTVKQVVCMSVLLQSTNARCNALQTVTGVFLHSCNTPETVREFLAHAGLSVSSSSINNAVASLSEQSVKRMRETGRTLMAAYAYDNLDIDLKHSVPTLEKGQDTLIHLTTGTMLPLHDVPDGALDCSKEMWEHSTLNPDVQRSQIPPVVTIEQLVGLYSESAHPSGLNRRQRYNAWKFLETLVLYGPETLQKHRVKLGEPEEVEAIPVQKTSQVPLSTIDIAPSTAAQNSEALEAFFKQAGVGDASEIPHVRDIGNNVVLVFGDLLTGERIRSLLESRSEEKTPWRRFQFIVYVMGLFHLKMACADALWRIFIHAKGVRDDENSLINHVGQIRPKETVKIETNPGFRRMHEVIQHTGIVSRLDCWRIMAKRNNFSSLEDFAQSDPSFETLQRMSEEIAVEFVASSEMSDLRQGIDNQRDEVHENLLMRQQYFLLYEEMSYALNAGDIGRVESLFLPWIFIFQGCGKHKYAAEMQRSVFGSQVIRMNILCNPTGKKGAFRAIDWLVEHNNLYIKRIYGGKYSNHQKERIIEESPLIEVYKNIRIQLEKVFCLDHKTTRHSPPKMKVTFNKLGEYMVKNKSHVWIPGRTTNYTVPDIMGMGMNVAMTKKGAVNTEDVDMDDGTEEYEGGNEELEVEGGANEELEVEDDGDLDV